MPARSDKFYAGVKKRPGPKRRPIAEQQLAFPRAVKYTKRSYTVKYKLRVLSYWHYTKIPTGPTTSRPPNRAEVSHRFKIPPTNLLRWKNSEAKLLESVGTQRRNIVPNRRWKEMEVVLYDRFIERRKQGKTVRVGWFRRNSKELWTTTYPDRNNSSMFCFSNG